ncbi:MAG: DUF4097 family beta strand repeat protein [Planctomycetales bacterium]|nr:DUF4097 family beta strand repeat protein [Planctomycetales bacterium]
MLEKLIGCLSCSLLLIASGCGVPLVGVSRTVSQQLETSPLTSLELATANGQVEVEPHDLPFVDMEVTYKAYGSTQEEADALCQAMDTDISATDGKLVIKAVRPKNNWSGSISYHLKVPSNCELKLRSSNGAINVAGTRSSVHIETSNGKIALKSVAGSIDARTSNGAIQLEQCAGSINAQSSNGRIEVDMVQIDADSSIKTSNGAVTVRLPIECSVNLTAHTSNGSIGSEMPQQKVVSKGKRDLNVIIGNEAASPVQFQITTSNGSIKVAPTSTQPSVEPPTAPTPPTFDSEIADPQELTL